MAPRMAVFPRRARSTERWVGRLFRVSLIFKGLFSVLEIVGGTLGYAISQDTILALVTALTQEELTENPNDKLAQYLMHGATNLSLSSQHFAALYLLSHGVVKTFLIVGLLYERLGYFPLSIVAFGLFVVYQIFRFQTTHSIWLLILTVVDIAIIALTVQEYHYVRRRRQARGTAADRGHR